MRIGSLFAPLDRLECKSHGDALRLELAVKRLPREGKEPLVDARRFRALQRAVSERSPRAPRSTPASARNSGSWSNSRGTRSRGRSSGTRSRRRPVTCRASRQYVLAFPYDVSGLAATRTRGADLPLARLLGGLAASLPRVGEERRTLARERRGDGRRHRRPPSGLEPELARPLPYALTRGRRLHRRPSGGATVRRGATADATGARGDARAHLSTRHAKQARTPSVVVVGAGQRVWHLFELPHHRGG
jgi:hypothetical protein